MSYSRWSHSRFYTYWMTGGGDTRDTQALKVHDLEGGSALVTYPAAKAAIATGTVQAVRDALHNLERISEAQAVELMGIFCRFVADIEEEHPHTPEPHEGTNA